MYYDDGCGELLEKERMVELRKEEKDFTKARCYHLTNGTVFSVEDKMIEFEDGMFYEVIQTRLFYNPKYERTGKIFTMDELNNLI